MNQTLCCGSKLWPGAFCFNYSRNVSSTSLHKLKRFFRYSRYVWVYKYPQLTFQITMKTKASVVVK